MTPARKAARIAYWMAPSLVCLLVYRSGFAAWFRADDFAWLGLTLRVHNFRDLLDMLVLPAAEGTFRPWSERAFFMAGFSLFGLDAVPFRILIFATQFANLVLVATIGNPPHRTARRGILGGPLLGGERCADRALGMDLGLQPGDVRIFPAAGLLLSAAFGGSRRRRRLTPRDTLPDPAVDRLPGRFRSAGTEPGLPRPGRQLHLLVRSRAIPPHPADVHRVRAVYRRPQ